MKTSILNKRITWPTGGVVRIALLVFLLCTLITGAEPTQEKSMFPFNNILSDDSLIRDRGVDTILDDRKSEIEKLIALVDSANVKKYSEDTRCAAAYLLGELRAIEAIPVLSKCLGEQLGPDVSSAINRYDEPAFEALVKIGRPAVPAMIENLKNSDERMLRTNSMNVLIHTLGGKRRLMELLAKLSDNALAEQPPDRKAAERFQQARAWAGNYYKEDKEPLY